MHSSKVSKLSLQDRIELQSRLNLINGCWEWSGQKNQNGYALISLKRKTHLAHRKSFEAFIGPIPKGNHHGTTCVCHTCDNRACVNPNHLFLATQLENVRDMYVKGRSNSKGPRGSMHGASKLSENDVLLIRILASRGYKQKAIADRFGVAFQTISKIVRLERWRHV